VTELEELRAGKIVRVSPLTATFAAAWLLVLAIAVEQLLREPLERWRLVATTLDVVLLALAYLWVTLHVAEIRGARGEGVTVDRGSNRSTIPWLIGMTLLLLPPIVLVPWAGMWWQAIFVVVAAGLTLAPAAAAVTIVVLLLFSMLLAGLVVGVELRLFILLAVGGAAMAVRHLSVTIEELHLAREELARRAVDEERVRIARDLHDLLGHSLSLVALKSELAGKLIASTPAAAAAEIRDVEQAARQALKQVRNAVTAYRQPTFRGELDAAREMLAASGIRASISDGAGPLPVEANTIFAWAVREGVTNVIRHSRARHCAIRTSSDEDCVSVSIVDDGRGMDPIASHGGSGLAGLRERADGCAGRLITGQAPRGGFELRLEMPLSVLSNANRS
jgi:two-component system sensor histidine kinase DesK